MASTRSQARLRPAAPPLPPGTPKQAFVALVRHGAHAQLAAFESVVAALTTWSAKTDRFAQSAGDELTLALRAAVDHIDARLERASIDTREVR